MVSSGGEDDCHLWRQGSVFSRDSATCVSRLGVLARHPEPRRRFGCLGVFLSWIVPTRDTVRVGPEDLLIIVSHSCDLVHHDISAEPFVEVLHARPCEEQDGNLSHGKNARRYQFSLDVGETRLNYEAVAHDTFKVPKTLLAKLTPDTCRRLPSKDVSEITLWLIKRYRRAAFPNEFNRRVATTSRKIRKLLKSEPAASRIAGIYILLETEEDLPRDRDYRISLVCTMREDDYSQFDLRQSAESVLDKVEALLGDCEGIEVAASDLKSEAGFTLADVDRYQRWDYDDLSLRQTPTGSMPPSL